MYWYLFWFLHYWSCVFFKLQMHLVLFEIPNTFEHLLSFIRFLISWNPSFSSWLAGSGKTIDFRTSSSSVVMWFIVDLFGGWNFPSGSYLMHPKSSSVASENSGAPSSDPFMTNASVSTCLVLLYMVGSNFPFIGTLVLFVAITFCFTFFSLIWGFFFLIIL